MKYRFGGKEKRRFDEKQIEKFGNSFELVAREWHATNLEKWTTSYGQDILRLQAREA